MRGSSSEGEGHCIAGESKDSPLILGSFSSSLRLGRAHPRARASSEDLLTKVECFAERLIG